MDSRILITGSSGFIGTNLVDRLIELKYIVKGVDILPPRNSAQNNIFVQTDLKDREALRKTFLTFKPQFVIHLAARTDLEGRSSSDYLDNTLAVQNLCDVIIEHDDIEKVIFTSSMLVCKAGYIPRNASDYCPTTEYGKSKVDGELIVRALENKLPKFDIVRPTSIWGPWFSVPYRNFFDLVLAGKYIRIGEKSSAKTYGYVGNAVNQIISLLQQNTDSIDRVYYVGDHQPMNADEWAVEIAEVAGLKKPHKLPFPIIRLAAAVGDALNYFGIGFPLTSFRLKNMTTPNVFRNLQLCKINMYEVVSVDEATNITINWIKRNK